MKSEENNRLGTQTMKIICSSSLVRHVWRRLNKDNGVKQNPGITSFDNPYAFSPERRRFNA